ncbi:MAG TPA: class I SAM-dependent methyltransferase [Pseudonocardiaceae bacterium]|jgi:ubiquinone/menaquinone biosynthesis C-methylase UbiE|nr:class I SAM-dependent methyltransferase [Pseudonocardiaceae bacterium]
MAQIDYDGRAHTVYASGRALTPASITDWMNAFARQLPDRRPLSVLDLGSGTGRFTPALADAFGGPVAGVEPSSGMREVAERDAAHPGVRYLAGSAERIPLPDGGCDVVVMFLSFHHFPDRTGAATEIARVLAPGGRVLVRSTFADRMTHFKTGWHRFFPRATEIERGMFPTVDEVLDVFARVGLSRIALEAVPVRLADNMAAYVERLRLRAISTFEFLTEEEIEAGFAAMDAAVAADEGGKPIEGTSDLLVLG